MSATDKQRAFIEYLGLPVPGTVNEARDLISELLASPDYSERAERWKRDRLRLHPEIYASELMADEARQTKEREELPQTRVETFYRLINEDYSAGHLAPFRRMTKKEVRAVAEWLDKESPGWDERLLSADPADLLFDTFLPATERCLPDKVKAWKTDKDGHAVAARKSKAVPQPVHQIAKTRPSVAGWGTRLLRWLFKVRQ